MPAKLCKYKCNTMIEWDDTEGKFYEQGSRTHHTRERCEEIRNKGGSPQSQTQTAGSAGIEQWAAIGVMLEEMRTKLEGMELKVDKALQLLQGQNTLEGSD